MSPLTIEAPTDAQITYVASLCREHGYPVPAIYSKQHASLLIEELRAQRYAPEDRFEHDPYAETELDRQAEDQARREWEAAAEPQSTQDGLGW